jgi:hypothetical protein
MLTCFLARQNFTRADLLLLRACILLQLDITPNSDLELEELIKGQVMYMVVGVRTPEPVVEIRILPIVNNCMSHTAYLYQGNVC